MEYVIIMVTVSQEPAHVKKGLLDLLAKLKHVSSIALEMEHVKMEIAFVMLSMKEFTVRIYLVLINALEKEYVTIKLKLALA